MSENKSAKTPADGEPLTVATSAKTLELKKWIKKTWKETQDIAQPKQWVGLTNKDIDDCYFAARQPDFDVWAFAQEIEEVLKLKNT